MSQSAGSCRHDHLRPNRHRWWLSSKQPRRLETLYYYLFFFFLSLSFWKSSRLSSLQLAHVLSSQARVPTYSTPPRTRHLHSETSLRRDVSRSRPKYRFDCACHWVWNMTTLSNCMKQSHVEGLGSMLNLKLRLKVSRRECSSHTLSCYPFVFTKHNMTFCCFVIIFGLVCFWRLFQGRFDYFFQISHLP